MVSRNQSYQPVWQNDYRLFVLDRRLANEFLEYHSSAKTEGNDKKQIKQQPSNSTNIPEVLPQLPDKDRPRQSNILHQYRYSSSIRK